VVRGGEDALTQVIVELASEYGRYGYRRISALLRHQGWHVNHKRVERIWRRERKYLTVWHKQPDGLWKLQADIFNTDGPPTAIEDQQSEHSIEKTTAGTGRKATHA
jgi:transposase InsO family protein